MDLSNSAINRIGEIVRQRKHDASYDDAIEVLNRWREAHGGIMDKYFDKCAEIAKELDRKNIIVAQRLKRLPTIIDKLNRFENMRLSSMQDIAGVRIIVNDMEQLREIEKIIRGWENLKLPVKDYIATPKDSGYRGKHFIFKENGMFVEVQLRTQLEHIWATSVETVDTFLGSSMKTRLEKGSYWQEFFQQVSAAFALSEESEPLAKYGGRSLNEICELLSRNVSKHKIYQSLAAMSVANFVMENEKLRKAYYVVLNLDFREKTCLVSGYKESDYAKAVEEYKRLEMNIKPRHSIVLVSVNDMKKLKDAYPNYFIDIGVFAGILEFMLEKYNKNK